MRTTLTLDDDVAALLRVLQTKRNATMKALVNEALRVGLHRLEEEAQLTSAYTTATRNLGECLIGNIDCIAEALAVCEGEDFR